MTCFNHWLTLFFFELQLGIFMNFFSQFRLIKALKIKLILISHPINLDFSGLLINFYSNNFGIVFKKVDCF